MRGVSRQAISKHVKNGVITFKNGKITPEVADRQYLMRHDKAKKQRLQYLNMLQRQRGFSRLYCLKLKDTYIKQVLGLSPDIDVPIDLIEAKRVHLQLKRLKKEVFG